MTGPVEAPGAAPRAAPRVAPEAALGFARLCGVVMLPFALGYFLSYLFRAVNAVVAPDIVRDLDLGASMLGVLTAAYLLAFALFQPILGVLLDRFGPRRVQAAMLAIAAIGALFFAFGRDAASLTAARALIGIGFSGGLMSTFKAVVMWFPPQRVPLANSLAFAFGGLGIVLATRPADMLSQALGWRMVFVILAAVTGLVALNLFLVVPERRGGAQAAPLRQQLRELFGICRDPVFWRLAPLVCATIGAHIAIQTLWIGNWLRDVAGMTREDAAWVMLATAVAFSVGSLVQGFVADWLLRRGVGVMATVMWTLLAYFLSEIGLIAGWTEAALPLWLVFGMTGSVAVLAYPVLSQHFGAALAGRSNTSVNLLMFGTAFAMQALIGVVVELWAIGQGASYDPRGYQVAFAALLGLQLLSVGWYWVAGPRRGGR